MPRFSPNHHIMHLLFDFGGVLVDLNRARCMQSFH